MDELKKLVIPLLAWYNENRRDLPWRRDPTPYHVWLSEIMLQQTRVAAVLDHYRRFLDRFPDLAALANAPEDALMKAWQGLGYYSRARNLQRAAQVIVSQYAGEFPGAFADIRALPGVGDYTAGAIASIAFGLPRAAVDGNVLRVIARVTGSRENVDLPATRRQVTRALEEVIPVKYPGDFNQALMELGALVCLPNGAPKCPVCPLRDLCRARRSQAVDRLPVRTPKPPRRVEERTVWLIFFQGRAALRKRPAHGLLAGLWEFPNDLSPAPPPVEGPRQFVGTGRHVFTHLEWRMTAYALSPSDPALPAGWVWADAQDLAQTYSIPSAFSPFLDFVLRQLER